MVRSVYTVLLMLSGLTVLAQSPKIVTTTELTPVRGYVGEPRRLSITVLTETFFTAPVGITNLKIDGAFLVPRQNTSTTQREGGKTYAGVVINFYVLPYEDGALEIPSVSFTTESPPPGDFRGKEVTVTTVSRSFDVAAAPPTVEVDQWIVAQNVTLRESWDRPLTDLKVGDVITRTVTCAAANTLSEFIPPIEWPSIPGVSLYPQQAQLENNVKKDFISGRRVEVISYLLEDSGSVVIPMLEIPFYQPRSRTLINRSIPAKTLDVAQNDELGLVASMKDSLSAYLATDEVETQKAYPILTRRQMAGFFAILLFLWAAYKTLPGLITHLQRKNQAYKSSEPYYFRQLLRTAKGRDAKRVVQGLYLYLDRVRPADYDHTLRSVVAGTPLDQEMRKVLAHLYQDGKETIHLPGLRRQLKELRKSKRAESSDRMIDQLNPS